LFKTIRNLFIDSLRRKGIVEFEALEDEIQWADEPPPTPAWPATSNTCWAN